MITKIDYIKIFGIYKNFSWLNPDLPNFKEKNMFYGWNYSGKTTLSRVFSSLQKKEIFTGYNGGDFKIDTDQGTFTKNNISDFPYKLQVFNSDYIKENLKWELDEEINAIYFEVGDKAIISGQIEEIENKILKIEGNDEVKGEKDKFNTDINSFNEFEDVLFTEESRRIKNDVFSSLIEFNKRNFKSQLNYVIQNLDSFILKNDEINRLSKVVKIESPKPEVDIVEGSINIDEIVNEANKILSSVPNKSFVIKILDDNPEALNWVEKGLELNKPNTKCLFCDNEISSDRIEKLNKYYQNEAAKLRSSTEIIFEKIAIGREKLKNLNFPKSVQDLNDAFQDGYVKSKKNIDSEIKKLLKKLDDIEIQLKDKISNKLYEKLSEVNHYPLIDFETKLKELDEILEANNKFTTDFDNIIHSERQKYINHLVAKYLKDNKYSIKQTRYSKAITEIEKLDKKVDNYKKEIERLSALKDSAEEGGMQFNYFVQSFLGKVDVEVKFNETAKKYNLYRGNELAKNLSEGEKMAISFSHYLVTLKSLEQKNELINTILFIDDPMSSLDGNHIFQINALLKDFLYNKIDNPSNPSQKIWEQKCKQLFVSTHSYEFFNLLKEMPTTKGFRYDKNQKKGNESRYFISRKVNESEIVCLPGVYNDFKSEYHFLFKEIYEFSNGTSLDKILLMPNVLRRFLEIYTLAKYPSTEEVDDRATEIWDAEISKRICKPFHYFSHFNNIDRIGQQSEFLADVQEACKELLKQIKKDRTHYKALKATL